MFILLYRMLQKEKIQNICFQLIKAYKEGKLWYMKMPEDAHPDFSNLTKELQIAYFTLPMALNYQRNSYVLWESALKTWEDQDTKIVFDVEQVTTMPEELLRKYLSTYKLALQPNKHIATRKKIATTVYDNRWSCEKLLQAINHDFLSLQEIIQITHKSWFPYLSWPKIFHYWSYIMQEYCWITWKHAEHIEIAPDTHITQCSVKLGIITAEQSVSISKNELSRLRREILDWTTINPIDMHSPLRFWSRNNFIYEIT